MKYSEANLGRVFILRLEDGEIVHEVVQKFAMEKRIKRGIVFMLGGAGQGSKIVVGPEDQNSKVINPMQYMLNNAHEVAGVGTIFPNKEGKPVLHLHASFGRKNTSKTGCIRTGVKVWLVMELIIIELLGSSAKRMEDINTGFELLEP